MNLLAGALFAFLVFLKFGFVCFGGGQVLTPLYIEDLVNNHAWMTLEEFGNLLAIAQATPGPIGVNAATFFGWRIAGFIGSVTATIGLLVPGFFLMQVALKSMDKWSRHPVVKGLLWGVKPATIAMMAVAALIFLELSVFTGSVPWTDLVHGVIPEDFALRPIPLAVVVASFFAVRSKKISIMHLILLSAVLGAIVG